MGEIDDAGVFNWIVQPQDWWNENAMGEFPEVDPDVLENWDYDFLATHYPVDTATRYSYTNLQTLVWHANVHRVTEVLPRGGR